MKKIMREKDKEEIVSMLLINATNKGLTINNLIECVNEVIEIMEGNATLEDVSPK